MKLQIKPFEFRCMLAGTGGKGRTSSPMNLYTEEFLACESSLEKE